MNIINFNKTNQGASVRNDLIRLFHDLNRALLASLIILSLFLVSCASKKDSIVITYPAAPRSLDCHHRKELITLSILYNIYEPLVAFDANMKIEPGLADYWEQIDSLTWAFYLRDNVLFHNGKKFGTQDVIYSLYRPTDIPESEFKQLQDVLDTIISDGENKILLKTRTPRAFILYDLANIGIMPEGFNPTTEAIGTGPYRFVEATEKMIILEAFPNYWGKKPTIKKVCFYFLAAFEDRLKLFVDGEADIITYVPITAVEELEHIGKVVASPGVSTRYLEVNLRKFPFNIKELRLAINIGIDREKLAKDVYLGYAVPANQYLEPGVFGNDPTRKLFDYDPDSAKKLISRLGDIPVIDFEYANVKYHIGEAIADEMRNIGLEVRTHSLPPDEYWNRIENKLSNCYIISMVPNSYEGIGDMASMFHTLEPARGLGLQNSVGYSNKKLDAILESLPLILDRQLVAQKLADVQDILLTDLPTIPIVWEKEIFCVSEEIDWMMRLDNFILVKGIKIKE